MHWAAEIRQEAAKLGFAACGFTTADPPVTANCFRRWLDAGCHGQMIWLERSANKRSNPQLVLSGAKSIIVLAAAYPAAASGNGPPGTGFIARYARFPDYHNMLAPKLKALTDLVNRLGGQGTKSLWYVDTGPLLERDLAQRAGLGFIGKHCNLISRRLGNWFFLAEIITTLELAADQPEKNRCGSCRRCLDACPTRAIAEPFFLDARRCIAYLTIELKGAIPVEWRTAIGNRIFGCDDCLAVCPWNRFAAASQLLQSVSRDDLMAPGLVELLALDEAGFRSRFGGTPVQRLGRSRLRRNVCVALGNSGDDRAWPWLAQAAQDPDPLVAEHARWAAAQLQLRPGRLGAPANPGPSGAIPPS